MLLQGGKNFARRTPPPPHTHTHTHTHPRTWGSKGQNSAFSEEHGHATYQVKGNHECNNMVANILHADPPPLWGGIQLFQSMVMLHIKLNGITNAATYVSPSIRRSWSVSENAHTSKLLYHMTYLDHILHTYACQHFLTTGMRKKTFGPQPRVRVKLQLFQSMIMLHIKLKGITNATTW